jgi:pimeloyl-ACP methyl ester carboxylesterase
MVCTQLPSCPVGALAGTTIHVRSGGTGPAVVLLHGYGETGDMWVPMATDLGRNRSIVVPDLRGLGLSAKPDHNFDKKTQAATWLALASSMH